MKRRNFLRLSGTLVAVGLASPGFTMKNAWRRERRLLLVIGTARYDDVASRFGNPDYYVAEQTNADSHFEAWKSRQETFRESTWIVNGMFLGSAALENARDFHHAISGNTIEKDLDSLEKAFSQENSAAVYLHSTDIAHYSYEAYEDYLDRITDCILNKGETWKGKIIVCTAMGRNAYGNGILNTTGKEACDHSAADAETGRIIRFSL